MDIDGTLTFNVPAASASTSSTSSSTSSSDPSSSTSSSDPSSGTSSSTSSSDPSSSTSTSDPSSSTTSTVGVGATDPAQTTEAFYVSPNGSDSNSGTLAAPFATLARAQEAMEDSSIKTTYVEGGTYNITSTIALTSADNGETWQYYAPNGVDSAILDGGNTLSGFFSVDANNITIDGLTMEHFYDSAIKDVGGHTNVIQNLTIENCNIGYNVETGVGNWSEAIAIGNATNLQILNNYVHDVQSQGIGVFAFNAGDVISGVISGNVVLNAVESVPDGGAIYVSMRYSGADGVPAGSSLTITNNYVADYGGSSSFASGQGARGIYLDDNSSNVIVSGNVIGPPSTALDASNDSATSAIFVHDGSGNKITGNIIDLGSSGNESAVIWGYDSNSLSGMAGNTFTGNIVISSYTGTESVDPDGTVRNTTYFQGSDSATVASDFTIENNLYYNYAGGQVSTSGNVASDTNPIIANPGLTGWAYQLASNSPAYSSPVSFTPIVGGWGPAGFVMPQDGAAASDTV